MPSRPNPDPDSPVSNPRPSSVTVSAAEPWKLDLGAVEELLKKPRVASIIAVSAGEVNTGRYSIGGLEEMRKLRALADQYKAWIHADGGK